MSFETYIPNRRPAGKEPKATILSSGSLSLNAAAMENWFSEKDYAVLLYSADEKCVAIQPVDAGSENALKVVKAKNVRSGSISGRGFLRTYGIPHEKTRQYPATWRDDIQAVVIKLGE